MSEPIRRLLDPRGGGGERPDYRFSLANERTFLAWIRTALALVGAGLAVGFLPTLHIPHLGGVIAVVLLVLGAVVAGRALVDWARTEAAMRQGRELPPSRLPVFLTVAVVLGALLLAGAMLLGGAR